MKTIILLSVIVIVAAAPISEGEIGTDTAKFVEIRSFSNNIMPDGSYKFSFETADGYMREETGSIVNPGREDAHVATIGSYKFVNKEGEIIEVHYTADTKGFLPSGSNILEAPVVSVEEPASVAVRAVVAVPAEIAESAVVAVPAIIAPQPPFVA